MRVSAIIAIIIIIFIFSINIMASFEQNEIRYDYNDITYTLMKLNSFVVLLRRITALIWVEVKKNAKINIFVLI